MAFFRHGCKFGLKRDENVKLPGLVGGVYMHGFSSRMSLKTLHLMAKAKQPTNVFRLWDLMCSCRFKR